MVFLSFWTDYVEWRLKILVFFLHQWRRVDRLVVIFFFLLLKLTVWRCQYDDEIQMKNSYQTCQKEQSSYSCCLLAVKLRSSLFRWDENSMHWSIWLSSLRTGKEISSIFKSIQSNFFDKHHSIKRNPIGMRVIIIHTKAKSIERRFFDLPSPYVEERWSIIIISCFVLHIKKKQPSWLINTI